MSSSFDLRCITCSPVDIKIEDVIVVKLSYDLKHVGVLMRDGTLRIISLERLSSLTLAPVLVEKFEWHSGGDHCKLVVQTIDTGIVFYSATESQHSEECHLICSVCDSLEDVKRLVKERDSSISDYSTCIRMLDYHLDAVTYLINSYIARLRFESNDKLSWSLDFKITSRGEMCKDGLHVVRPYLFILWTGGIIDGYDLMSRQLKVTIDLNSLSDIKGQTSSLSVNSCSRFSVSSDLEYVVLVDDSENIAFFSLRQWLSKLQIDVSGQSSKEITSSRRTLNKQISGFIQKVDCKDRVETTNHLTVDFLEYNNISVKAFKAAQSCLLLWDQSKDLCGTVIIVDKGTQKLKSTINLREPSYVILAANGCLPHLILTSSKLSALVYNENSEGIISKLMTRKDSCVTAVYMAKLNDWKSIFIPYHILALCLKDHRLEGISFYLKNHEFDRDTIAKFSIKEVSHLQSLLLLLKSSIYECIGDLSVKSFGERLLQISLGYLISLLKTAVLANNDIILNLIMDNLNDIRSLLLNHPKALELSSDLSNDATKLCKEWLHLDKLNIIRSSLQGKCLPLVQTFFLHNSFEDFDVAVNEFPLSGLQLVIDHLNNNDVNSAIMVLKSLDFDVSEKLKHIYFHTMNRRLRKTIEDYFLNTKWLTDSELVLINRFHFMEERYPCQSIIATLDMLNNSRLWGNNELIRLSMLFGTPESRAVLNRNDVNTSDSTNADNCDNFNYNYVLVNWTINWEEDTWGRIIMESLVRTPDPKYSELINPRLVWKYLLLHNRFDIINDWLNDVLSSNSSKICNFDCLLNLEISQEIVESISSLIPYNSSLLLDKLTRCGIFSANEMDCFPQFLKRVGRTCDYGDKLSEVLSLSSVMPQDVFHTRYIQSCIDHNLPCVLWNHVNQFSMSMDLLNAKTELSNWLSVIYRFKQWADHPEDMNYIYTASIANAKYILESVMPEEITKLGLIGFASLLYQPESMKSILSSNDFKLKNDLIISHTVSKDDWDFILGILTSFEDKDNGVIQDVSVYDLLKENCPLEISQLFGWQCTNNLKTSDGFKDLPYFSHVDLVKKFGYIQELDYTYYIRQGRPLFAYVKFITSCALTHDKISASQINRACNVAHGIAIESVCLPHITASCVTFMELLNCNTQGLRIDLEVFQLIMWYQNREMTNAASVMQINDVENYFDTELATLLEGGIYENEDKLRLVMSWAERSMVEYLIANEICDSSLDALHLWSLLNLFCQRHGLPYSTVFLRNCVESGNWIMLLIFVEIFQYSRDKVWQIIDDYGIGDFAAHLKNVLYQLRYHSLSSVYKRLQATVDISKKVRANLYSKIGVKAVAKEKSSLKENSDDAADSIIGESSDEMTDRSSTSSSLNNENSCTVSIVSTSSHILGILLQSHQHASPWQNLLSQAVEFYNPTLAVIAACYQEASLLECLCVWYLAVVCPQERAGLRLLLDECIATKSCCIGNLLDVTHYLIKAGFISVLVEGFYYFIPDSPLYSLLKFLKEFLEDKCYETSIIHLKDFQSSLSSMTNSDWQSLSSDILLEDFCISILNEVLINLTNRCERLAFLFFLTDVNIEETLKNAGVNVPKYSLIYTVEEVLSKTNIKYYLPHLLKSDQDQSYIKECREIINCLVKEKHYLIANQFVVVTGYPQYEVLLAQAHGEIASRNLFCSENGINAKLLVWKQYYFQFKESDVPAKEASDFLKKYGFVADDLRERYYIFHLAWLTNTWPKQADWFDDEIEREMWLARIRAEVESENTALDLPEHLFDLQQNSRSRMKTSRQVVQTSICNPISKSLHLTTDKEKQVLEKMIGFELDNGNIDIAYRLTLLFEQKCLSLSIIMNCMQLAEGIISEGEINDRLLQLIDEPSKRSRRYSGKTFNYKIPVLASNSSEISSKPLLHRNASVGSTTSDHENVLRLMNSFLDVCKVGKISLSRVITFYKISLVLKENYEDIILKWDNARVLKTILQTDDLNLLILAKDFISAVDFEDELLAPFLCEHIIKTLHQFMGNFNDDNQHNRNDRELFSNPADASAVFLALAKLCEDPASLGNCLLECIKTQLNENSVPSVSVELSICSHHCFTLACHVGGITTTLQVAKKLTKLLASAGEYSLMVRLLIGMGRFSEMPYIFDILRSHHRFELLFRKGMEKVPGFKLALLDYMKRFHPHDTEMFTMIALHFRMYREIAETLENLAKSQLKNLHIDIAGNLIDIRETFEIIMQYLADAAESYVKAECLQHAVVCAKQAELVALQVYLLQSDITSTRVLNLSSSEVTSYIVNNNKFSQAYIVAEAYGHHQDWALALYSNYVVKNDESYFTEFCSKIPLSVSLVEEITRRFMNETAKQPKMTSNIRHLLNFIDDVQVKYQLANELGFNDLSMTMLADQSVVYLQRSL